MSSQDYKKITTETYNQIAIDYAERDRQNTADEVHIVQKALGDFITSIPAGARVLDIGSGGGRDSRYLFRHGFTVTGIDSSAEMIRLSKANEPSVDYIQMDMEQIMLPDSSFDAVWANASLHHIPKSNLSSVIHSLYRVLKPSGYMMVIVKHGDEEGIRENANFNRRVRRYFALYSPKELEGIVTPAGFKVLRSSVELDGEWVYLLAQKV